MVEGKVPQCSEFTFYITPMRYLGLLSRGESNSVLLAQAGLEELIAPQLGTPGRL